MAFPDQGSVCERMASRKLGGTCDLAWGNSTADGQWGGGMQVPFEFTVSQAGSQSAELRISAGTCDGTSDLDDFEVDRIRVCFIRGRACRCLGPSDHRHVAAARAAHGWRTHCTFEQGLT
jgi:hypothetical protein